MHMETSHSLARSRPPRWAAVALLAALGIAWTGAGFSQEKEGLGPVQVTIKDEKAVVVDSELTALSGLPVDPVRRINFNAQGLIANVSTEQGQTLHLGVS